jgi:predicted nucleic-acid-binding protein
LKIIADTNLLVRLAAHDHSSQEKIVLKLLTEAELVAIPMVALCEFVWVMRSVYKFNTNALINAIRLFSETQNIYLNQPATKAGLETLEAGGDFADGVIAYEGKWLGGEVFASFDKEAIALLKSKGHKTKLL